MLKKIEDKLWIGSMPTVKMLEECGARAVVSCVKKGSPAAVIDRLEQYACYPIPDGKRFDEDLFRFAVDDVEHWRAKGHTVLVHCHAGRNRSATVAALVLMRMGWTGGEAVRHIRNLRPRAIANPVFEDRLLGGVPL